MRDEIISRIARTGEKVVFVRHVGWCREYHPPLRIQEMTLEEKATAYENISAEEWAKMQRQVREKLEEMARDCLTVKGTYDVRPSFNGYPLFDAVGWANRNVA